MEPGSSKPAKRKGINVQQACKLLGYSKQAYYQSLAKQIKQAFQTEILLDLIKDKRKLWKKGSGRNLLISLQDDLNKHNIKIG